VADSAELQPNPAPVMSRPQPVSVPQPASISTPDSPAASTPKSPAKMTLMSGHSAADYVVKSGDTLTRIARLGHTTIKAIESANDLDSDRIVVGEKLKIPAA
jgi:peptidoglycan DL-endopeptidase LytE